MKIIIDHIPKTAGQALNNWLAGELKDKVSDNHLLKSHSELLQHSDEIICAHIDFSLGEKLNPDYQYITCIREPVDRAISWMFYTMGGIPPMFPNVKALKEGANLFFNSDGEESNQDFLDSITNAQVKHFCTSDATEEDKILEDALTFIKQYTIIGIYAEFPEFLEKIAKLVNIPIQSSIPVVNDTQIGVVSPAIFEKLNALNELDLKFYNEVCKIA